MTIQSDDRLPEHPSALELFSNKHFDTETARILARSELEHGTPDDNEQPSKPLWRMTGAERNG